MDSYHALLCFEVIRELQVISSNQQYKHIYIQPNGVISFKKPSIAEHSRQLINTWNANYVSSYLAYAVGDFIVRDQINLFAWYAFGIYTKGPLLLSLRLHPLPKPLKAT